jgi:glycine cleavage system H protein
MIPENLKYTQEHEWVKIEGDIAIVGVSDFAQEQLGEVTFVELPLVGQVNNSLEESPESINNACYDDGWVCKIKVSGSDSADALMDANAYDAYLKGI